MRGKRYFREEVVLLKESDSFCFGSEAAIFIEQAGRSKNSVSSGDGWRGN